MGSSCPSVFLYPEWLSFLQEFFCNLLTKGRSGDHIPKHYPSNEPSMLVCLSCASHSMPGDSQHHRFDNGPPVLTNMSLQQFLLFGVFQSFTRGDLQRQVYQKYGSSNVTIVLKKITIVISGKPCKFQRDNLDNEGHVLCSACNDGTLAAEPLYYKACDHHLICPICMVNQRMAQSGPGRTGMHFSCQSCHQSHLDQAFGNRRPRAGWTPAQREKFKESKAKLIACEEKQPLIQEKTEKSPTKIYFFCISGLTRPSRMALGIGETRALFSGEAGSNTRYHDAPKWDSISCRITEARVCLREFRIDQAILVRHITAANSVFQPAPSQRNHRSFVASWINQIVSSDYERTTFSTLSPPFAGSRNPSPRKTTNSEDCFVISFVLLFNNQFCL